MIGAGAGSDDPQGSTEALDTSIITTYIITTTTIS